MEKKEITIYDIAKALDLSAATVSRSLNDNKSISSATRQKVIAYAEKVGYQTNSFAANLRNQETKTIGVIVPKLDSNFISTFLAGAEKIAGQKGYDLLVSQSFESVEKEIAIAKTMFRKRVDGLIVSMAFNSKNINHFNIFRNKKIPIVFFDRTPEISDVTTFVVNNFEAAKMATEHLIQNGRKNLLHLTMGNGTSVYDERISGFNLAVKQNGAKGNIMVLDKLDLEGGKKAAERISKLKSIPNGIFAANDQSAVGCILGLQKLGITIPNDMAVVGFNNEPVCEIISPEMSSMNYPSFSLGEMVTNSLIEHILGNSSIILTQKTVIKSELFIRNSSNVIK